VDSKMLRYWASRSRSSLMSRSSSLIATVLSLHLTPSPAQGERSPPCSLPDRASMAALYGAQDEQRTPVRAVEEVLAGQFKLQKGPFFTPLDGT